MAPKTSPKVAAQCRAVEKVVKECSDDIVPAAFRPILASAAKETLSTLKADRHPFQQKFAEMINQAVAAHGVTLKKAVADAEAAVNGAGAEKETRTNALGAATSDYDSKVQATTEAKNAKEEAAVALKGAKAALKEAEHEQSATETALPAAKTKLEKLTGFKAGTWGSLADGTIETDVLKDGISTVKSIGKECKFDGFMMKHLPDAFGPVADRGTFDVYAIKTFSAELDKAIADLSSEIGKLEKSQASSQTKVEAAKAALTAATEKVTSTETAASEAVAAEKVAAETKKAAQHSLDSCDKEAAQAAKDGEEAKKELAEFEDGAAKGLSALESATKATPGYYAVVEGVHLDAAILAVCKAKGDGPIDMETAKTFVAKIAESGDITKVERWTLRYVFGTYSMSEEVHDFINAEVEKLPQPDADEPVKKRRVSGYYMTIDGVKCDSAIINACNNAVKGMGDGRVSVEDAHKVLAKVADGGKITQSEQWTMRFCMQEYKWTQAATDFIVGELKKAEKDTTEGADQ